MTPGARKFLSVLSIGTGLVIASVAVVFSLGRSAYAVGTTIILIGIYLSDED